MRTGVFVAETIPAGFVFLDGWETDVCVSDENVVVDIIADARHFARDGDSIFGSPELVHDAGVQTDAFARIKEQTEWSVLDVTGHAIDLDVESVHFIAGR